jgi:hypothetical protein
MLEIYGRRRRKTTAFQPVNLCLIVLALSTHIKSFENIAAEPFFFAMISRKCYIDIKGRAGMYRSDAGLNDAVGTQSLKILRYRGVASDSHPSVT